MGWRKLQDSRLLRCLAPASGVLAMWMSKRKREIRINCIYVAFEDLPLLLPHATWSSQCPSEVHFIMPMFQSWQRSQAEISEAICPGSYSYEASEAGFEPRASCPQEPLGERGAIRTYSQSWSVPEKLQAKEGEMDRGCQSDPQKGTWGMALRCIACLRMEEILNTYHSCVFERGQSNNF